ncbi:MAG: hypothetical protein M1819_007351 [Sarea resinae]|nr:MAG: hypothetical protein M1819_007351 [Sarea resinae]
MSPHPPPPRATQNKRHRPTATVPIIPAVPLAFSAARPSTAAKLSKSSPVARNGIHADMNAEVKEQSTPIVVNGSKPPLQAEVHTDDAQEAREEVALAEENPEHIETAAPPQSHTTDTESSSTKSATRNEQPPHSFQLPPPFYPNQASSPSSVNSSSRPHPRPYGPPLHQPHPSAGSLVFGGYPESSSSSPAPPTIMPGPPPLPPGYFHPNYEPQFHPLGHGHHNSETQVPFLYPPPPPPNFPQQQLYGPRRDGYPNFIPGPYPRVPPFPPPESQRYSPSGAPRFSFHRWVDQVQSRQATSSRASLASSAPQDPEQSRRSGEDEPPPVVSNSEHNWESDRGESTVQPAVNQNGTGMSTYQHETCNGTRHAGDTTSAAFHDDSDGLAGYLISQFGNRDLADYIIELSHLSGHLESAHFPVHSVLVARSPSLNALIHLTRDDTTQQAGYSKVIKVKTQDRFIQPGAFDLALRRLYGSSLLEHGNFTRAVGANASHISWRKQGWQFHRTEDQMAFALAYAAAGHLLQFESIIRRGLGIAARLVSWETVELALSFALDGEDPGSQSPSGSPAGGTTYAPYSTQFLFNVLGWLVVNFPSDFVLDATSPDSNAAATPASQSPYFPRFPNGTSKPSRPSSRLSCIQFGDYPSAGVKNKQLPSLATTVLSRLLISLPFSSVQFILGSRPLGGDTEISLEAREKVARDVVSEREKARRRHGHRHGHLHGDRGELGKTRWRERVKVTGGVIEMFREESADDDDGGTAAAEMGS